MKKSCEDGAHIMNHALLKTILHFASVQKGAQKKKNKKGTNSRHCWNPLSNIIGEGMRFKCRVSIVF